MTVVRAVRVPPLAYTALRDGFSQYVPALHAGNYRGELLIGSSKNKNDFPSDRRAIRLMIADYFPYAEATADPVRDPALWIASLHRGNYSLRGVLVEAVRRETVDLNPVEQIALTRTRMKWLFRIEDVEPLPELLPILEESPSAVRYDLSRQTTLGLQGLYDHQVPLFYDLCMTIEAMQKAMRLDMQAIWAHPAAYIISHENFWTYYWARRDILYGTQGVNRRFYVAHRWRAVFAKRFGYPQSQEDSA